MERKICELFAGVGGFRLGFLRESDSWEFVYANQWEPSRKRQDAFNCYIKHFGKSDNHVNEDINNIDKKSIPKHNLLVAGFPCQDYSIAKSGAKGINGKKGVLWWQLYEVIKAKRPEFFLLENVDRLLKSPKNQRGRDFLIMLKSLNDLGYSVEWRVINSAEYGFSQKRIRVFIFGYKNTTQYYKTTKSISDSKDMIINNGFFADEFPISEYIDNTYKTFNLNKYELIQISEEQGFGFENSGICIDGNIFTMKVKAQEKDISTLREILEENIDSKYFISEDRLKKIKKLKMKKSIKRQVGDFEYNFQEGSISFPDQLDKPSRTMLTSEGTINRSTHVILDPIKKEHRLITPLEAEKLNGFDSGWTEGMSDSARYFCMGNALVVGVVERLAKSLSTVFNQER